MNKSKHDDSPVRARRGKQGGAAAIDIIGPPGGKDSVHPAPYCTFSRSTVTDALGRMKVGSGPPLAVVTTSGPSLCSLRLAGRLWRITRAFQDAALRARYDASMTDARSPLAARILDANPRAYERLVVDGAVPTLGHELLDGVTSEQLLSAPIRSQAHAQAMLAGLWLWHDALDRSHRISQNLPDAIGSFWHAIMHRREGDFPNSKYWFARCGNPPVYGEIAGQLPAIIQAHSSDRAMQGLMENGWAPASFVDLVEGLHDRPDDPRHPTAVAIQRLEWRTLFAHCVDRAVA